MDTELKRLFEGFGEGWREVGFGYRRLVEEPEGLELGEVGTIGRKE